MLNVSDEQSTDSAREEQLPSCPSRGCCGMEGRGGKVRLGVMIVAAIAVVVLLARGFAG